MTQVKSIAGLDLTWLAKRWDRIVGTVEYPTKVFVFEALQTVNESFMRGRGLRMGSYQNMQRLYPQVIEAFLMIATRVAEDDSKEIWFPNLLKVGLTDRASMQESMTYAMRLISERDVETGEP